MKLGQIVKMVMVQAGEDVEDTDEYRESIIIYINEGYRRMMEKYQPTRTATLYAEAGKIDASGLTDMRKITGVCMNESGRETQYEAAGGMEIRVGGGDAAYDVEYTYNAAALGDDTDEPALPEGVHMALADYATWRFYGNGNLARQQRGLFYYQRFMMELDKLIPAKQRGGGHRNFHGLFDCT